MERHGVDTPVQLGGFGFIDLKHQLKGKRAKWIYSTLRRTEYPYSYLRATFQEMITSWFYSLDRTEKNSAAWYLPLLYRKPDRFSALYEPALWIRQGSDHPNLQIYLTAWFEVVTTCDEPFPILRITPSGFRDFMRLGPIGAELLPLERAMPHTLPKGISDIMIKLSDCRTWEVGIQASTFHHTHSHFYRTTGNHPIVPKWAIEYQYETKKWGQTWKLLSQMHERFPGILEAYHLFLLGLYHRKFHPNLIRDTHVEEKPFANNPKCALCLEDEESLPHIVNECSVTRIFWAHLLGAYFQGRTRKDIETSAHGKRICTQSVCAHTLQPSSLTCPVR